MMRKVFLCLSLISLCSVLSFGQTKKVVTNFDLEKYRQQRIKADADYDLKAQAGTVPSKAELDKREQERQKFISEFSQKATAARNEAENYWQAQAYQLQNEIAAVEAETNYVRARVNEIPQQQVYYSIGSLPYSYGGIGYGGRGYGGIRSPQFPANTGFPGGGRRNAPINNGQPDNLSSIPRISPSKVAIGGNYGRNSIRPNRGFGAAGVVAVPNFAFGGFPYPNGILAAPYSYQTTDGLTREELVIRLQSLEQQRAGLYARLEALRDAAQQQGVNIN